MQIAGSKTTAACEMDETGQGLHDGQQARIVQLHAWCPTSAWGDGGLPQLRQLATIDIGLQHVLLDSEVAIVDAAHHSTQLGQVVDRFADAEVASVVAGGFVAEQPVVTHVLLDGAELTSPPQRLDYLSLDQPFWFGHCPISPPWREPSAHTYLASGERAPGDGCAGVHRVRRSRWVAAGTTGDLDCIRCALATALRICASTIADDDLDARVLTQPTREHFGGAVV